MKVWELIEELHKQEPHLEVILSTDEEGNGSNPVRYLTQDFIAEGSEDFVGGDDEEYIKELREESVQLRPVVTIWP